MTRPGDGTQGGPERSRTNRTPWLPLAALVLLAGGAGCTDYGPPSHQEYHDLFLGHSESAAAAGLLSPSARVRRWSIVALARQGDPVAADAFMLLLDPSKEQVALVRATAAVGLRMLGDKRAVPSLRVACYDPEPLVRADAARAVGCLGGPEEIETLGPLARRDPDSAVRLEAVYAIQRIGGDSAMPVLMDALNDPDESVAFAAHAALTGLTGQQFSPDREQWLKWWEQQHPPQPKP